MNIVNALDGDHLAYWVDADGVEAAQAVRFAGEHLGAEDCNGIVTQTSTGPVVRVAWKPDEIDLAHLATGGTIWLSAWGGLPPHMLEVQPGERAPGGPL